MLKPYAIFRNTQIHIFLFCVSLLLVAIPAYNKTPSKQIVEQSVHAAAEFLFLVDTEEYAKSWEASSETLQRLLTREAWQDQITEIRSFIGPVIERVYHDISYTSSASNVPSGEYVIMTFISKFEFREQVIETLTLLLGDNGQWRVVGYFLR